MEIRVLRYFLTVAREESIDDGSRMQPGTGMHSHSLRFIYDKDRFILIDDIKGNIFLLKSFENIDRVSYLDSVAASYLTAFLRLRAI